MNLLNISPFSQYVVRGVILLAAVIFDRYKQKPNVRPEFKPNFLVYRVIAASARFAGGNYQKWRGWSHCLYLHGSHIINNQLRLAMIRRKQGG